MYISNQNFTFSVIMMRKLAVEMQDKGRNLNKVVYQIGCQYWQIFAIHYWLSAKFHISASLKLIGVA